MPTATTVPSPTAPSCLHEHQAVCTTRAPSVAVAKTTAGVRAGGGQSTDIGEPWTRRGDGRTQATTAHSYECRRCTCLYTTQQACTPPQRVHVRSVRCCRQRAVLVTRKLRSHRRAGNRFGELTGVLRWHNDTLVAKGKRLLTVGCRLLGRLRYLKVSTRSILTRASECADTERLHDLIHVCTAHRAAVERLGRRTLGAYAAMAARYQHRVHCALHAHDTVVVALGCRRHLTRRSAGASPSPSTSRRPA